MLNELLQVIGKIYRRLGDEVSKRIFQDRLMYSATCDAGFIQDVVKMIPLGREFSKSLVGNKNYIWGAGSWGKEIAEIWPGYWAGFFDNNVDLWNKSIVGRGKVLPPETLRDTIVEGKIFITTRLFHDDIRKQLENYGVPEEKIVDVGKFLNEFEKEQYFDLDELTFAEDEVFVDVGAFDGQTSLEFVRRNPKFGHIYMFEPDEGNRQRCRANIDACETKDKMTIISKGLWSKTAELSFKSSRSGSTIMVEGDGSDTVSVVSLDETLGHEKVTFIKMDIEGAEAEALTGAKEIIREQSPKLAISIYHKVYDILEIPQLILGMNPNYQFFLRHYTVGASDTVLYALPVTANF